MGRVIRNFYFNFSGFIINFLIALLLTPFIVHSLGEKLYGIWGLIISITGYFSILNFGVYHAVIKYISQFKVKDDYENMSNVASACFSLFAIVGLSICALSIPLAINFSRLFKVTAGYKSVSIIVFLALLQLAAEFPFRVFRAILSGLQRYDITNSAFIISAIVRAVLMFVFLKMGFSLLALVSISLILTSITYGVLYFYIRFKSPDLHIRLGIPPRNTIKLLFNYSTYSFVIFICSQIVNNSSVIIIALLLSAEAVTYFVVASRFILYLQSLIQSGIEVLTPAVSEFDAKGADEHIRNTFFYSTKLILFITLPAVLFTCFLGGPFFTLWLGEKFIISSYVLIILVASYAFIFSLSGANAILYGIGRLRIITYLAIIDAITCLSLSIVLAKPLGVIGVALGISIPLILFEVIARGIYMFYILKIPVLEFFRRSLMLPLASSIILAGPLMLLRRYFYPHNWGSFFAEVAVCSLIYLVAVAVLGLRDNETKMVFRKFIPAFNKP